MADAIDTSRMPYQLPFPAEAVEEVLVSPAVPRDERSWVPQAEGLDFRPLLLHTVQGYWCNLLRVRRTGVVSRHRHPQPVTGYVIKGRWHYLEHDWVAEPGAFLFEPPGETHQVLDLLQHRAVPSAVFTPGRLLAATASLMARSGADRGAVLREVGDLLREDVRRRRLMQKPAKRAVLKLHRASPAQAMGTLRDPLRALDRPALVVWGTGDAYIPRQQAERQLGSFPSARIELLEGLGHWPFLEDPGRVNEHVVPFLREVTTASP